GADLGDEVDVDGEVVHRRGVAAPVPEDVGRLVAGGDGEDLRVGEAPGDVVDERRPGLQAGLGRLRVDGVDAEHGAVGGERPHDGQHPVELDVDRDTLGAGTGRLPTDVEHVGALVEQQPPVRDGRVRLEPPPAVGEGVGRDVDDPHDEGAPGRGELG